MKTIYTIYLFFVVNIIPVLNLIIKIAEYFNNKKIKAQQ